MPSPEPKKQSFRPVSVPNGDSDFDALFTVDHIPLTPADKEISVKAEEALLDDLSGLVNISIEDAIPYGNTGSPFLSRRRELFSEILEKVGRPDYAQEVRNLMVTYDDISQSEQQQGALLQKVLTYADKAIDLIKFIDVGEMLVGNPDSKSEKDRGLIGLNLDDLRSQNLNKAKLEISAFQQNKETGLGLSPSSVKITDDDIEAWLNTHVEGYKELRYEYNIVSTITRTLKRFLWQINRVAQSNERLVNLYPSRFDISDLKKYFESRLNEIQKLIEASKNGQ